jgi:ribonuclease inhibitor
VVELPDCVVLQNWQRFAQACPRNGQIIRKIIADYHLEKPGKQLLLEI